MTITEARAVAESKCRKDAPNARPVSYKDFGDHYGFFVAVGKSDKMEVGDELLFVNKKNRIATWKPITTIGRQFRETPTIEL